MRHESKSLVISPLLEGSSRDRIGLATNIYPNGVTLRCRHEMQEQVACICSDGTSRAEVSLANAGAQHEVTSCGKYLHKHKQDVPTLIIYE